LDNLVVAIFLGLPVYRGEFRRRYFDPL